MPVKCKDCRYLNKLPPEVMKKLEHKYCYVCIIPFMVGDPDVTKDCSIVDAQILMFNERGIEGETKCEFYKGWDA